MKKSRASLVKSLFPRALALLTTAVSLGNLASAATAPLSPQFQRNKVLVSEPPVYAEGPSSIFLTLLQDTQTNGPIRHDDGTGDVQYVNEVYRLINIEADKLASFYIDEGNPEAYIAFMAGAIAVPFNESKFQQFRKPVAPNAHCSTSMNDGVALAHDAHGAELVAKFKKYLAKYVPSCRQVPEDEFPGYTQVMSSFDGQSFGLFQENYNEFPDFLDSGDFLDVSKTAADGLQLYMNGFKKVVTSAKTYGCIVHTPGGPIDWENLVRGAWSGPYNSGNTLIEKVCRFVPAFDKTSIDVRWNRENDIPFGLNYVDFLDGQNGFIARMLTGAQLTAYQTMLGAFSRMGRNPTLSSAEALEVANSLHEMITNPPAAPAPGTPDAPSAPGVPGTTPTLSAGIVALKAPISTSGEIPVDHSVKQARVSDDGEVATQVTMGFNRDMPRTMYVNQQADVYLSPSTEQSVLIGSVKKNQAEVRALKRVVTRTASGAITGHWIEIELPDDDGLAEQIRDRDNSDGSKQPVRPGTNVYVQASQLDSLPGKILGHFQVTLHSGTLNLHLNHGTSSPIRDWAANHEVLEAIDSFLGPTGITWYKIYSPYTNANLWASGHYLKPDAPKAPRVDTTTPVQAAPISPDGQSKS